ncbi:hypothetical protein EXIGLDRAFT_145235 [Exidia glandulosa HHB12029]|uniref:UvrD-like helicase ATP-binding domain-containing protein n=1 Tax=Exidia glandulosa HHB12029 TaxID=1314781 RepID=A0A165ND25_EXIGL|nr:hypothetical protein EXIGLDRAFT_145235 [Exidia glandulosa HHB12029]
MPAVPTKAALYFESVEDLGPWRILISSRADRNLRELRRGDAKMFKIVMKKMKELSNGHFSDDNQKRLTGRDSVVDIFEAKMTRDLRLVYRVDCFSEYGSDSEIQALCVYGLYTHAQLGRGDFWNSMGIQLARKGKEYGRRCAFRIPVNKGGNVYTPASFPAMPVQEASSDEYLKNIAIPQEDLDELHALLVLEKFVMFSQALLNSIIADVDVTHPFNPSAYEKQIIEHPYSCFVIGRSGTGKTTTMLFKMLGRERAWRLQQDTMRKPRQLFVTQSRVLAGKVEDFFRKLYDSFEVSGWNAQELKNHDPASAALKNAVARRHDLLDVDDDDNWGSNLPARFSELEDEHFPLFTTYDQLSKLIEADVDVWLSKAGDSPVVWRTSDERNMMSYTIFRSRYWPRFAERLTKGLDPALVYSEILGVIKGSEESLHFPDRLLDQATYEGFSTRRQGTFASHRKRVYDISVAYERLKRENSHIDAADRTHALLRLLQSNVNLVGHRIDYLYVDEAQDNLLIDALLLRTICSNPQGLFWAGDTAQTISVGSSFRFNDLKAFLHRVEEQHQLEVGTSAAASAEPPTMFQLSVNYRSHGGIVSCAHTVISLITAFWPDSIDHLAEERGIVDGVKPVFFAGWDQSTVRYEQFLFGSGSHEIEFGARQCIIVRTEEAQAKLRSEVGDIGVIMTVYEAKGLEFDDVLLYNFFEDSSVTLHQWRVVLNDLADENDAGRQSAPRFDPIRHAGVCADLKSLYVAITRARKHMWIVDRSDKGEPMRTIWTARNQIQNCTPDTDVPHLAVSSTPAEWEEQAKSLFRAKRYLQARHCFQRAEKPYSADVANAYYLRDCAKTKPVSASKRLQDERLFAFVAVADAFAQCADGETSGANDRERSVYYRRAGESYQEAGRRYFKRAAECFERAAERAGTYEEREAVRAAKLYQDFGDVDNAVRVVQHHKLQRHEESASIIAAAKLFYFNRDEIQKGCLLFIDLDEAVEYCADRGLDIAQAAVLELMGRWSEAADVHLQEGRVLLAAETYLRDDNPKSAETARDVTMRVIWEQIAFGRDPRRGADVGGIEALIQELRARNLDSDVADELQTFEILASKDYQRLKEIAESLHDKQWGANERVSGNLLLAMHFILERRRLLGVPVTTDVLVVRLETMLAYVRLLRDYQSASNPSANPLVQKLFGFRPHGEKIFTILRGTCLHGKLGTRAATMPATDDGILITERDLEDLFRIGLFDLVRAQIRSLQSLLSEMRALEGPCLQMFMQGACTKSRTECPYEHIAEEEFTAEHYNMRIRAHTLALTILGAVDGLVERPDIVYQERLWSSKLYEALHPVSPKLGDPSLLDVSSWFPKGSRGRDALHSWVRPQLYSLRSSQYFHVTSAVQCAWMCFAFNDDAKAAHSIISNAPLLQDDEDALRIDGIEGSPSALQFMIHAVHAPSSIRESFLHGVDFVRYILEARQAIDMTVLCNLFEELVAILVVSWHLGGEMTQQIRRLQDRPPSTSERRFIMLPRSWCLAALRHRLANRQNSIIHLGRLVHAGSAFISQILEPRTTGSALYYRGTRTPPPGISNIVVSRICHALCILGYNFDLSGVRNTIVQTMSALPKRQDLYYEVYASAKDWHDLARATKRSLQRSKLDCMVWIASRRFFKSGNVAEVPPVINILFDSFQDLEQQLRALIPGEPQEPLVRVPKDMPSTPLSALPFEVTTPEHNELEVESPLVESSPDDTIPVPAVDDDASDVGDELEHEDNGQLEVEESDTDQKHAAARKIQFRYRQKRSRDNSLNKSSGDAVYFAACLAAVETLPIPPGYYRKVFLGPLPYILSCLQTIEMRIVATKHDVKKQLKSADPSTYEVLDTQLTAIGKAHRQCEQWRRTLKPESKFHVERNVLLLKRHATDVNKFIQELPYQLPRGFSIHDVRDDLARGVKGIVEKEVACTTPPRAPSAQHQ